MIKELTKFLDYGVFAEIALLIFAMVFLAIVVRTLLTSKEQSHRQASIVLADQEEVE